MKTLKIVLLIILLILLALSIYLYINSKEKVPAEEKVVTKDNNDFDQFLSENDLFVDGVSYGGINSTTTYTNSKYVLKITSESALFRAEISNLTDEDTRFMLIYKINTNSLDGYDYYTGDVCAKANETSLLDVSYTSAEQMDYTPYAINLGRCN